MKTNWTPESLAAFERDIADCFNRGEIKSPVHLAGGNEAQLIEIFERVHEKDWVCTTWRSHLHCLLKGVPAEKVKAKILEGRSIGLCFREYNVISSAMVGGILPVALGLGWPDRGRGWPPNVWCFVGDMAAASGLAHECAAYAKGFRIPLNIVVESNGKSVMTDTKGVWGGTPDTITPAAHYDYHLLWPHVGTGRWVNMESAK